MYARHYPLTTNVRKGHYLIRPKQQGHVSDDTHTLAHFDGENWFSSDQKVDTLPSWPVPIVAQMARKAHFTRIENPERWLFVGLKKEVFDGC